ncbi:MAG: DUF2341 domain-containing protein [Planctomycetaceae bacterium]
MPKSSSSLTQQTRLFIAETMDAVRRGFGASDILPVGVDVTALEQRLLMSASPIAAVAEASPETVEAATATDPADSEQDFVSEIVPADGTSAETDAPVENMASDAVTTSVELVVIDPSASGYEQLIADLKAQTSRHFEILLLNARQDGIAQITDTLKSLTDVSAVHLVSHGEDGEILLGASVLSQRSLGRYAPELLSWNASLTADADLLIYGCDLAATDNGRQLAESLNTLLGTDVAASTDDTGNAALGGNWTLESTIGTIETDVAFSQDLQDGWLGLLTASTYRDAFSAQSFNNSDGSQSWATSAWQEAGENDGAAAGSISIQNYLGHSALKISGAGNTAVRQADLSTAQNAILSFDYAQQNFVGGENVTLEISTDGTLWTILDTFSSSVNDTAFQSASYNITSFVSPTTQFRLTSTGTGNQALYIDNFLVSFTTNVLSSVDEFRVTTAASGNSLVQETSRSQAVASAADGSYVVVWSSQNQDGSGWGVYARRFDSAGNALTGEIPVAETTQDDQKWARVGSAADGSFVVTWSQFDGSGNATDVYARRFDAAGNALGSEFIVNQTTAGTQTNSSISVNSIGEFVIAWEGSGPGDTDGIFLRRFHADGTAMDSTDILVNTDTSITATNAATAMNDNGLVAVTWQASANILLAEFDATGAKEFADVSVVNSLAGETLPVVGIDAAGNTTVIFRSTGIVVGAGVWGRSFDTAGNESHPLFQVSDPSFTTDNSRPSITMDAAGNFVVVYDGTADGDGAGTSVKIHSYNASGVSQATASVVNTSTTGNQQMASVAMLDPLNLVIVWSGAGDQPGNADTEGVFATQIHLERPVLDLDANNSSGASGRDFLADYLSGSTATSIVDSDAVLTDADGTSLQSLTVTITDQQDAGNEVLAAVTAGTNISASYFSGVLRLTGMDTVARYQQVLQSITYVNNRNPATGTSRTITFVASDGMTSSLVATTHLTITPSNQAPVNTVPATQTAPQNTPLVFSSANSNAISVSDPDAGSSSVQVTLTATNGTLTLAWPSATATAVGTEVQVNTTTSDTQSTLDGAFFGPDTNVFGSPRAVASDPAGNTVVTWTSKNQDGDNWGIYAQRFNAAGVAQGSEFLVNTTTSKAQLQSSVALDDSGNFVITWSADSGGGPGFDVYAQRYSAAGAPLGAEFRVNSTTNKDQIGASVAMAAGGDFVITWSSKDQDGDNWGVYGQRYSASGTAVGGEFRVNNTTAKEQTASSVTMAANGSFVVTWSSKDQDGDNWGIYGRRFDAAGVAAGNEFQINTTTTREQQFSSVAADDQGNFVVTWSSKDQDGDKWGVYAQRYNAAGVAQGGEFLVNQTTVAEQQHSSVSMDSDGDFVITWTSKDQDGDGLGVYARQYSASGTAKTGEVLVNATTSGDQFASSVAMNGKGGFVVVWSGEGGSDTKGVFAQRFEVPNAVTLTGGDGIRDTSVTLTGSISNINALLNGLTFSPTAAFNGTASITVATDDLGNTGLGGAKTDTDTVNITVGTANAAPVVAVSGGTVTWTENSAAVLVATSATVSDADSPNFDGGQLTVFFSANGGVHDQLQISHQGTANGQIGVSGSNVTYNSGSGAVVIGTFSGGTDGTTPLIVQLNGSANVAGVQSLIRRVTFLNTSDDPGSLTRSVGFRLSDGDGGVSSVVQKSVTVIPVNDAPVIASGQTFTIAEDAANGESLGIVLATDAEADTVFSGWQITSGNSSGAFTINSTTGELSVADRTKLNAATQSTYTLSVKVSDGTTNSGVQTVTVNVTDVADVSSGLVLHLAFDETSGTTAADSSGQGNNAVLSPAADNGWTGGVVGSGAYYFNATSGQPDFFTVPDSATLQNVQEGSAYSLAAWFNPDSVPTGGANLAANDYAYALIAKEGQHTGLWYNSSQKFVFEIWFGGTNYLTLESTTVAAPDHFYQVTGTLDRASGVAKLYINGTLETTATFTAGATAGEYGTETWKVGTARDVFTTDDYGYTATGVIDDARIYSRNLSAADVAALVSLGSTTNADPVADAGGSYSLNSGQSLTLDASGSTDANGDTLIYRWDLDNDGNFTESGEPTGVSPTVSWATIQAFGIDSIGSHTIGLRVEDGQGGVELTMTTIVIAVGNTAPVAGIGTISSITEGSSLTLDGSSSSDANFDTDPKGNGLKVLDVSAPNSGTVVNNDNGTVTYTPATGFTGTASFSSIVTDSSDGLTHYWGLNGDAVDSVGTANGMLQNGVATVAGAYGTALSFDEVDDAVVIPGVSYSSEFTVSFKFRVDDYSGDSWMYMYSHGDADLTRSLNVMLGEDAHTGFEGKIKTIFSDDNDAYGLNALVFDATAALDGNWHTYTLTVDAATGSNVYLDGVLKVSDATRGGDSFTPIGDLYLGAREDLDPIRYFGGGLDSVAIFDRSLQPSEVASLTSSAYSSSATASASVTVTVSNSAPVAAIGTIPSITEGASLTLDGSSSSDANSDPLTYEWDLNYNGTFSADATGVNPTISWATLKSLGIDDNGTYQVALRVHDGAAYSSIVQKTLTVTNAAPTLTATGSSTAVAGNTYTLNLSASDAGDDTVSAWTINWGDGNIQTVAGGTTSIDHVYSQTGFTYSVTVAATDEDGTWTDSDVYVTSHGSNQLFRIDGNSGAVVSSSVASASPVAVVLGPDGLLYVSEYGTHDIDRYNLQTGQYVDTFVYSGSGGLNLTSRMAFGPDGNLYVSSEGTGEILKFSGADGRFLSVFTDTAASGIGQPDAILFGPNGDLYVGSATDGSIRRFDGATGASLGVFATFGTPTHLDLHFGPNGNLYASSTTLNVIREFQASTGAMVGDVVTAGSGGMVTIGGFQWTPDGNLLAVDFNGNRVLKYSASGTFLGEFVGTAAGMSFPLNVLFTPSVQVTVNAAPVAIGDSYTISEGASLNTTVEGNWFNSGWKDRVAVSVDNTAQTSSLTSVPVLVRLHATATNAVNIDFSKAGDVGQDLRFVDSSGNVLAHEIETWNPSGYSEIWVQLPALTAASTNSFWLYYNNPSASDADRLAPAWTSTDVVVMHLNGTTVDSSSAQNSGGLTNVSVATGIVGSAGSFNGSTSTVNLGSDSSVDDVFVGGGTISAWIQPRSWGEGGYGRIADKASTTFATGSSGDGWAFQVGGTGSSGYLLFEQGFSTGIGEWKTALGSLNLNTWQHVAIVYDSSSASNVPKIYIDGVLQALTTNSTGSGSARSDAALNLTLGNFSQSATRTFDGNVDEFRVSTKALTAADIAVQYGVVAGGLVAGGVSGTGPGGLLQNDSDADTDHLTVSLVSGPSHAASGSFALNADGSFTYTHDGSETTSDSFVYAISDGFSTSQATVSISVTPVNDNIPVIDSGSTLSVFETAATGAVLGTLTATDIDPGTTFSNWTITGGNTGNAFAINATTGQITVATPSAIDYETLTSYSLTVTVSDGTNTSAAKTVSINVTDQNDQTPVITTGQSFSVSETAASGANVGTVSATDGDAGTTFSNWTITGGNTGNAFAINATTGQITVATPSAIDYETLTGYTLNITVSDGVHTSAAQTVTVSVTDQNDNTPVITAGQSFSVSETATAGASVGTVSATDSDTGTTFSNWTITGGNTGNAFGINATTGQITVATPSAIDYETLTSFTLTVTASDGVHTSAAQSVTVSVTDQNDSSPVITAGQTFSVSETATSGTSVGSVSATDGDAGTTFSNWTITGGNTGNAFAINATTGQITVATPSAIDYETLTGYTLNITVSDGVHTSAAQSVTVSVTDQNDNLPVITAGQIFGVSEAATAGSVVGVVQATDPDSGTTFSDWAITGGNADNIFAINASTGQITVNDPAALDYETSTSHVLQLTVSDGTQTSAARSITINVTDVNDNTPVITPSQTFTVAENSAVGTSLGTAVATDSDSNTVLSNWTITGGTAVGVLQVNSTTGEITVANSAALDFETIQSLTMTVTVTDGVNISAAWSTTVTITDVNDELPVITGAQSFSVSESAGNGTAIGNVQATDADAGTVFQQWTIVSGNTNGVWEIDANTGDLSVANSAGLDFETQTVWTLQLRVSDGAHTSATETVTISVLNENDTAPVITAGQQFSVSESATDLTTVGTVSATDADGATTFSGWTITSGNADGVFGIDANGSVFIADRTALDFETRNSYSLTLTVSDGINTSVERPITISIADENDNAPVITANQSFSIAETAANGTVVGTAAATDRDSGTVFSGWAIAAGNDDGIFEIRAATGELIVTDRSLLNFETTSAYTLSLTVSDGVNVSAATDVTISILDRNDEVPVITAGQSFTVSELAANGTSVGTVAATDADAATVLQNWTITGGNSAGIFKVNSSTGEVQIRDNSVLNFEAQPDFVLTLAVSDGLNTAAAQTVTIHVSDENEAPLLNVPTSVSVTEDSGQTSVNLTASDPDAGTAALTVTAVSADQNLIRDVDIVISGTDPNLQLLFSPVANAFGTTQITVSVSDGVLITTRVMSVTITPVNDAPQIAPLANMIIAEDTASGDILLTLSDVDTPASLLTVSATSDRQDLISNSGIHITGSGQNRILTFTPQHNAFGGPATITVSVSDGQQTQQISFQVTITPVNDSPFFANGNTLSFQTNGSLSVTAAAPGLLNGAVDPEGDPLIVVVVNQPTHGNLTVAADGSFRYEADPGFFGTDSFSYLVSDGNNASGESLVQINVPISVSQSVASTTTTTTAEPTPAKSITTETTTAESAVSAPTVTAVTAPQQQAPAGQPPVASGQSPTAVAADDSDDGKSGNLAVDSKGLMMILAANDSAIVAESLSLGQQLTISVAEGDRVHANGLRDFNLTGQDRDSLHQMTQTTTTGSFLPQNLFTYERFAELKGTVQQITRFEENLQSEYRIGDLTASAVAVTGTSIAIGTVVTALRTGMLALGFLSQLPVWTLFDPLMVMDGVGGHDDDDSLQDLVDRQAQKTDRVERDR